MHVGTLGGICFKFLWQALANLPQRWQKVALEVTPGGFFYAQGRDGKFAQGI